MDNLERRFQVSQWIAEDFAGVISEADKAKLDVWRKESTEHEAEYQELLQDLETGREITSYSEKVILRQWKRFQQNRIPHIQRFKYWFRYASLIILLLGIGTLLHWQFSQRSHNEETHTNPIQVAQGEVKLILSNGETVVLGDSMGIVQDEPLATIQIAGQTLVYQKNEHVEARTVYNTLVVPRGGEYRLNLADGSQVWLNSETELRYPVSFSGTNRQVYLKGEAYFEVAKNADQPFIVTTTDGVDVKVLGTKFNISSYANDASVITTLVEGSVEVSEAEQAIRLIPDEQLVFDKVTHGFDKRSVDATLYTAWKNGEFVFENQPLEKIITRLQRWYEMEVFYVNDEVKNYRFSGELKKYEEFNKIIKMLEEVADLKITIKNECIVIGTK